MASVVALRAVSFVGSIPHVKVYRFSHRPGGLWIEPMATRALQTGRDVVLSITLLPLCILQLKTCTLTQTQICGRNNRESEGSVSCD